MRKIAFINTLTSRGAERQVSHLMDEGLFDLLILMDDICFYPVDRSKLYVLCPGFFKFPLLKKIFWLPVLLFRLVKYLKADDLVVSFLEISNYLNLFSRFLVGHRAYVSVRTLPSYQYGRGIMGLFHRLLIRVTYARADRVISNSLGGKKDLQDEFGIAKDKVVAIANGYPVQELLTKVKGESPYLEARMKPGLIYVAGLVEGKGHGSLLEVFAELKVRHPGTCLLFLGEGNLRLRLEQEAKSLRLRVASEAGGDEADVYFLGQVKNPYPWMKGSELFLFPSQWEGLPNALIEAGLVGANIVSADAPWGPREILQRELSPRYSMENYPQFSKSGVLLPVLKSTSPEYARAKKIWVETLVGLLNDQGSREALGKSASEEFKRYDLKLAMSEWKSLLEKRF